MLWYLRPHFQAWEREERRRKRLGINYHRPTTADFRHLLPPMDPAIIPRLKAAAKSGKCYQIPEKPTDG